MSAGPIKAQRDAWKPTQMSTPDAHRVCAAGLTPGRAYCGRKADSKTTKNWADVVCSDCRAARNADEAAKA